MDTGRPTRGDVAGGTAGAAAGVPGGNPAAGDVPEAVLRIEEQVVVLIRRSRQLWRDAAAAVHPDLQPVGYRLLTTLTKYGPSSPGRLADALETDKSVVSRQVRILEQLGLLRVEPDPEDGRGRRLVATDQACRLIGETRRRALAGLESSLTTLGPGEVEQLHAVLLRINAALADSIAD